MARITNLGVAPILLGVETRKSMGVTLRGGLATSKQAGQHLVQLDPGQSIVTDVDKLLVDGLIEEIDDSASEGD